MALPNTSGPVASSIRFHSSNWLTRSFLGKMDITCRQNVCCRSIARVELCFFRRLTLFREANVGPSPGDVTYLLKRLADGDQEAAAKLVPLVYEELRRLAVRRLRHERPDHTLQPTALVHEAYMKLAAQGDAKWQNRTQFFAVASQLMRQILVDYARGQQRIKRGGKQRKVSLEEILLVSSDRTEEVLAVNESLARLEKLDPRQGRIVELRYFGGLTVEEAAELLGISAKTVMREWKIAKAWLYGDLRERHGDDAWQLEKDKGTV